MPTKFDPKNLCQIQYCDGMCIEVCFNRTDKDSSRGDGKFLEFALCLHWIVCNSDNTKELFGYPDARIETESGYHHIWHSSRFWDAKAHSDIRYTIISILERKCWPIWARNKKSGAPRIMIGWSDVGKKLSKEWNSKIAFIDSFEYDMNHCQLQSLEDLSNRINHDIEAHGAFMQRPR